MTLLVNPQVPLSCSGCCCFCSSRKQQDFLLLWKTTRIPPPSPVLVLLPHTFSLINHHQGNSQTYRGKLHEFLFPLQCLFFSHTLFPSSIIIKETARLIVENYTNSSSLSSACSSSIPFPLINHHHGNSQTYRGKLYKFLLPLQCFFFFHTLSPHQSSSWKQPDLSWTTTTISPPSPVLILLPHSFPLINHRHHHGNDQTYRGKPQEFLLPLQCLFFLHTLSPNQSSSSSLSWKLQDLHQVICITISSPPPSHESIKTQ